MENKINELSLEPGSVITAQDVTADKEVRIKIHNPQAVTNTTGYRILASIEGDRNRPIIIDPKDLLQGGVVGHLRFPGLANCEPKTDDNLDSLP